MPRASTITPEKFATFGELLRFLRRKADLTQRELAIAVGYSESQISRLEQNERAPEEATLAARFVPALYIEDEPQLVARLLELGASTRTHTSQAAALQPIAEAKSTPHNLPIQLTSFIGREKEIAEIKRLLSDESVRLLTLTGPGGCGKTRLALQAASSLLDGFRDGVWLVEFAPLTEAALVPQTVAVILGLKEEQGYLLLTTLTNHLLSKRVLLVLDNCEHLIQPIAQLAETILQTCPDVHILSTSREILAIAGERALSVPSLSLPDQHESLSIELLSQYEAVRLFTDRAAVVMPGFSLVLDNVHAIAQICQRLDGIPLAIELAAARIKILSAEQIAARLNDAFHLLTGGSRTALPRQQTLQATMGWSYDLLSEKEQHLFNRLSVFAGGWTLEAAEAVCAGDGIESGEILDLLMQLVNKSLIITERVQGEEISYRMLEIIRQYALEKLTASSELNEVQRRHARYYLAQAQANVFAPGLYPLEQKHDNMRTALVWCLSDTGDAESGLHLAAAIALGMFHPAEACRWLEAALARADTLGMVATFARADALLALGTILAVQGDYAAGRAHMTQSLKVFRELGERSRISFALNRLGWLAREQGDSVAARAHLEESIALNRELGNKVRIAWGLITLGEVALLREEDTTWAIPLLEEGLALMKEQKDARGALGAGWALNHLGHIAQVRGEIARARRLHEDSISLFQQLEELPIGIVWGFQSLGEIALAEGKAVIAARHFVNALGISQDEGFRVETAWCLAGLAGAAALSEEPERAVWLWGAAEALRQSMGVREAPASRATHERLKNVVRQQLGQAAFNAKWAEGQAASVEQAIAKVMS